MKKIIYSFILLLTSTPLYAQVGIGTNTPDNSAMLEVQSLNKGILFPRLTSIQRLGIPSPAAGLHVFDVTSNSLWFFDGATWINYAAQSKYGDVKSGIQTSDHEGWILLDGRPLTSLSTNQQAVASTLGLTGTLPNASNSYLSQNGGTLGSVSGANTVTLTQGNLPNVSFTGSAASAGNHTHDTDPASFNSSTAGNHDHWVDPPNTGTSIDGSHTHSSNANGGYGAGNLGLVYSDGFTTASSVDFSWFELNLGAMPQPLVIYDNGNHWHNVDIAGFASSINGNHLHAVDVPSTTSTTNGAHTHSVSVSSGGSATPVNIAPQSLSVNMFIYLGN